MVVKSVNLETVCGITSKIPENLYYEVAFAGKSNVGKSSLINTLLNRTGLARISSQPGKTQTINFYNVNEAMYLVDLPGYGYARANEEIKAQWGVMIENYLHTSKMLKAVFLLIDIRHDPSDNDCLMYDWMVNQGFAPIIIATKADKLKPSQIPGKIRTIEKVLQVESDTVIIPFSAETKQGREEVWELMGSLVFPEGLPESMLSRKDLEAVRAAKEQAESSMMTDDNEQTEGLFTTDPDDVAAEVLSTADLAGAANPGAMSALKVKPAEEPKKKERWKKTDHPVAKKTAKKLEKKKAENVAGTKAIKAAESKAAKELAYAKNHKKSAAKNAGRKGTSNPKRG